MTRERTKLLAAGQKIQEINASRSRDIELMFKSDSGSAVKKSLDHDSEAFVSAEVAQKLFAEIRLKYSFNSKPTFESSAHAKFDKTPLK